MAYTWILTIWRKPMFVVGVREGRCLFVVTFKMEFALEHVVSLFICSECFVVYFCFDSVVNGSSSSNVSFEFANIGRQYIYMV